MKALIVFFLLLATGQASAAQPQVLIDVQHDSSRQVTCWITPQGGISCLPDSLLPQKTASITTGESQAARASLTSPAGQTEQLPASPLPQVERFRL